MARVRRYVPLIFVAVLVCALIVIGIPVMMRLSSGPYIYTSVEDVPSAQVAIVPGASVYEGEPSPILEERADTAIMLYETGKVGKILVSGDNATKDYNEVNPVQRYLLAAGIPAQDIFLDHAGFDTYSTMYRAQTIFKAESAIVVTQDFHLPRAVYIGRHLGMPVYGVVAEGAPGSLYDYLREVPASDKALLDLIVGRIPQYLGSAFPLTGSGTSTWY